MISLTLGVRVLCGRAFLVSSLVGVDAIDKIIVEKLRPEVSVPTAQAVGHHAETRGVFREVVQ
jgi:hypothetical protein